MVLRCKNYCCVLFALLFTSAIRASVLKEVLEDHFKDLAHNEGVELIKHDKQKGEKNHHIESQINDSQTNQYSKASDNTKYLKKEHDSNKSSDNDAYSGYNTKQDKNEDNETTGFKRGHKKGHHKQGFQNSYHKDESSNKSTYFDDFNDEGDQSAYNAKSNSYDNHGGRSYKGTHNNGQEYIRNNFDSRGHNRYGDVGNKQIGHQDYAKKHYLDDYENYNKHRNNRGSYSRDNISNRYHYQHPQSYPERGWDWQNWEDRNRWERPQWNRDEGWGHDYGGSGYHDEGVYGYGPNYGYGFEESQATPVAQSPAHLPVVAQRKQTITIYEDPRYDGSDRRKLRHEEGDYLHLDFKPSHERYGSYDDTYYNAPNRQGAMETSRINRLVYNYRRH
ncbi:unnamed protein product [Parnassius mnemosyne]|uniref:Uncharacterized protein n=1 Tax=Parnassius mnemosyne TaxID=213953 RepID=A0AAV1K5X8_9NEOP